MRYSRKQFLIVSLLAVCMLTACASEKPEIVTVDLSKMEEVKYQQMENASDFQVTEHELPVADEDYIGEVTALGDKLFYEKERPIPMGIYNCWTEIYEYDLKTGTETLLRHIAGKPSEEGAGSVGLNELVAVDQALFWIIHYSGSEQMLEKMDLDSGQVQTIRTFPDHIDSILLSGGDHFVSWYETEGNGKSLYVYDTRSDQVQLVSDGIAHNPAAGRALIRNGLTAFTKNVENHPVIVVFDLETMTETFEIHTQGSTADPIANERYVVWCDQLDAYPHAQIFAYDRDRNTLVSVVSHRELTRPFSFDLLGDFVFINDKSRNDIIARRLDRPQEIDFTSQLPGLHQYSLGRTVDSRGFIALDDGSDQDTPKILYIRSTED